MNSFANLNLQIPDLWEVRDVINKVKNVVLNYTEMEAKVHEATNNEAWGASSTLMQEIAQATFNYQYFNEIMPTIYKRFTEKESRQWRQIYKSLVLLEYLVKNGSEKVVDDARSHISVIKMLKNFYYVDEKGKDQGLNVRNRSKELSDLLSNVDLIKSERKKAKKNRNKYTGVGSDGGGGFSGGAISSGGFSSGGFSGGFSGGGGSKYEGFGSDYNSNSSRNSIQYNDHNSQDYYEEDKPGRYDDDFGSSPDSKPAKDVYSFGSSSSQKKEVTKIDDDWGDFASGDANDDFDTFQSAPSTSASKSNTKDKAPVKPAAPKQDLFDLLGDDDIITTSTTATTTTTFQPQNLMLSQPMSFQPQPSSKQAPMSQQASYQHQPISQQPSFSQHAFTPAQPTPVTIATAVPTTTTPPAKNTQTIGGIWSQASNLVSLDSLGKNNTTNKSTQGPSMNSLKSSSINAGWNNWATSNPSPTAQKPKSTNAFDDLLF